MLDPTDKDTDPAGRGVFGFLMGWTGTLFERLKSVSGALVVATIARIITDAGPFYYLRPASPSDTVPIVDGPPRGLRIINVTGGNTLRYSALDPNGTTLHVFDEVVTAGQTIPVAARLIHATGTTATVALGW